MMSISPEYIQPLREEVESIVKEQGWTKSAIFNMRKLDSFLREAQRLNSFSLSKDYPSNCRIPHDTRLLVAMERQALKDFTFSNGTFIPKGTYVAAVARPVHMDEDIYEDPLTFKPFRFAEAREGADDAKDAVKNQLVTTSLQYLLFGHGKHAW
jgi:hypothetical protein